MTSDPVFKGRVGTTQPQARRELPFRLKASALALALCLAGCGDTASTAEPATTSPSPSVTAVTGSPTSATTASPTTATTASPTSEPGNGQWKATGASFGVDRAQWPGTIEGARTLLNALPKKLAGQARTLHTDPRDKNNAGAEYGTLASVSVGQEYVTRDTASGKPELLSANNLLAAHFNLGAACTKNSYRGTLPKDPDYPGPAVTEKTLEKVGVVLLQNAVRHRRDRTHRARCGMDQQKDSVAGDRPGRQDGQIPCYRPTPVTKEVTPPSHGPALASNKGTAGQKLHKRLTEANR